MEIEQESITVRVPKDLADRIRAMAVREMTQAATIYRRVMKVGVESEEARLHAESAARRVAAAS